MVYWRRQVHLRKRFMEPTKSSRIGIDWCRLGTSLIFLQRSCLLREKRCEHPKYSNAQVDMKQCSTLKVKNKNKQCRHLEIFCYHMLVVYIYQNNLHTDQKIYMHAYI